MDKPNGNLNFGKKLTFKRKTDVRNELIGPGKTSTATSASPFFEGIILSIILFSKPGKKSRY